MYRLTVTPQGGGPTREFPFDGDVRVGSSPADADVVLEGADIAPAHSKIELRDGRFHISDLGSPSGTFVNGDRVRSTQLDDGDVIRIASYELAVGMQPMTSSGMSYSGAQPAVKNQRGNVVVTIAPKGGEPREARFSQNEITIGRERGNDIVLPMGNVTKLHSRVVRRDGKFIVVDLKSTNGTFVNGKRIHSPHVLRTEDKIYVGDFTLTFQMAEATVPGARPREMRRPPAPSVPANRTDKVDARVIEVTVKLDGKTATRAFRTTEVTIGRASSNDVVLYRDEVSKRHARLVLRDGKLIVVNLKSTNGVFVDGERIDDPMVLTPGQTLSIGGEVALTIQLIQAGTLPKGPLVLGAEKDLREGADGKTVIPRNEPKKRERTHTEPVATAPAATRIDPELSGLDANQRRDRLTERLLARLEDD